MVPRRFHVRLALPAVALLSLTAQVSLLGQTAGSPALSRAQQEQFLLRAKVIRSKTLPVGTTNSRRLTLDDGSLTHDAQFQAVDIFKPRYKTARTIEINFRDSYKFNIAAYRLDKLLGLNLVPVSVERKVGTKTGALTWWVDDVLMMEKDRYLKHIEPPDRDAWNRQIYQARVFEQLVANTDDNLGNFLVTKGWKLWTIDFTRAFRSQKDLLDAQQLVCIAPTFLEALKGLREDAVKREIGQYLSEWELEGLLARRQKIVELFERKAAQEGQDQAFCAVGP